MSYSNAAYGPAPTEAPPKASVTLLLGECHGLAHSAHETLNQILGVEPAKDQTALNSVPNGSMNNALDMLRSLRASLDQLAARCGQIANGMG